MDQFDFGRIDILTGLVFVLILVLLLDKLGAFKKARELIQPPSEHAAYMDLVRQVYERAINAMIVIDAAGKVILWSPRATVKFEWTATEAIGQPLEDLIIPDEYRDMHRRGMKAYFSTGKSSLVGNKFGVELVAQTKSKNKIRIKLWLSEIGINGVQKVAGFIADRTEEYLKEEAYKSKLKVLEYGEEIGKTGAWYWDITKDVVSYTHGFAGIFGVEFKAMQAFELMEHIHIEDRPIINNAMQKSMQTGEGYKIKYRIVRQNLSVVPVVCIAHLVKDDRGKGIGFKGFLIEQNTCKEHDNS